MRSGAADSLPAPLQTSERRGAAPWGRWGSVAVRGAIYLVLLGAASIALAPLVWLVAATTKGPDDLFHYTFFAPRFSAVNFQDLFRTVSFLRYLVNSVFIACTTVMVQLFFSSLAGFAFAKYEFRGKRLLFAVVLASVSIPQFVTIIPVYGLMVKLGLVNTYWGLILPGMVGAFGVSL